MHMFHAFPSLLLIETIQSRQVQLRSTLLSEQSPDSNIICQKPQNEDGTYPKYHGTQNWTINNQTCAYWDQINHILYFGTEDGNADRCVYGIEDP